MNTGLHWEASIHPIPEKPVLELPQPRSHSFIQKQGRQEGWAGGPSPHFGPTQSCQSYSQHHHTLWLCEIIPDRPGNWEERGVYFFIFSQFLCSETLLAGESIHSLVAKSRMTWDSENLWRNPATLANLKARKGQIIKRKSAILTMMIVIAGWWENEHGVKRNTLPYRL